MIKLKDLLKEDEVDDAFGEIPLVSDTKLKDTYLNFINDAIKEYLKTNGESLTTVEYKVLEAISMWLEGYRDGMSHSAKVLMKYHLLLQSAKSRFPKVFKPELPIGTDIYRGVGSGNRWLNKTLSTDKDSWEPIHLFGDTYYRTVKSVDYNPRTALQSWTSNERSVRSFSHIQSANISSETNKTRQGEIFLMSKLNDEFIFNENFLYTILRVVQHADIKNEYEVIHFGKTYSEPVYIVISSSIYNSIK